MTPLAIFIVFLSILLLTFATILIYRKYGKLSAIYIIFAVAGLVLMNAGGYLMSKGKAEVSAWVKANKKHKPVKVEDKGSELKVKQADGTVLTLVKCGNRYVKR